MRLLLILIVFLLGCKKEDKPPKPERPSLEERTKLVLGLWVSDCGAIQIQNDGKFWIRKEGDLQGFEYEVGQWPQYPGDIFIKLITEKESVNLPVDNNVLKKELKFEGDLRWGAYRISGTFVRYELLGKEITPENALKKLQCKLFQSMAEEIYLRNLIVKLDSSRTSSADVLKKLNIKQLSDIRTIQQRILAEEFAELVEQCDTTKKKLLDTQDGIYKIGSMIRRIERKQAIARTLQVEEIKELLAYLEDSSVPPIVGNLNLDEVLKKELSE